MLTYSDFKPLSIRRLACSKYMKLGCISFVLRRYKLVNCGQISTIIFFFWANIHKKFIKLKMGLVSNLPRISPLSSDKISPFILKVVNKFIKNQVCLIISQFTLLSVLLMGCHNTNFRENGALSPRTGNRKSTSQEIFKILKSQAKKTS